LGSIAESPNPRLGQVQVQLVEASFRLDVANRRSAPDKSSEFKTRNVAEKKENKEKNVCNLNKH